MSDKYVEITVLEDSIGVSVLEGDSEDANILEERWLDDSEIDEIRANDSLDRRFRIE